MKLLEDVPYYNEGGTQVKEVSRIQEKGFNIEGIPKDSCVPGLQSKLSRLPRPVSKGKKCRTDRGLTTVFKFLDSLYIGLKDTD